MSTRKAERKSDDSKTPAQEASEITWVLKGHLKNAQISYLRVGSLLAEMRDRQLYKDIHFDDMERYAEERLNLGRTSLYRYLQVYDWVAECHPAWLEPKPEGFIPDLSDAAGLMWIERKLASKDLDAATRAKLEELRAKGLEGKLRQRDLDEFRESSRSKSDALRSFLSTLRNLRRRGARLEGMPSEAVAKMDAAIELIAHAIVIRNAGAGLPDAA
jgi:hypothetical protein